MFATTNHVFGNNTSALSYVIAQTASLTGVCYSPSLDPLPVILE